MISDLLIIGGGIIGRTIAFNARRAGFDVTLIDDGGPRASAAAAGMLAPSFEVLHHRATTASAVLLKDALPYWDAFIEELGQHGADVDYQRNGIIALDFEEGAFKDAEPIAVPEGFTASAAVLLADEGQVDPRRLLSVLTDIGNSLGIASRTGHVTHLEMTAGGTWCAVLTENTSVEAKRVVLAGGIRTPEIESSLPPLTPIRGQAFQVRPVQPLGSRVIRTPHVYICPKQDGTVYIGATEEPEKGEAGALERLWQRALTICPVLSDSEILSTYDGARPASPAGVPYVDPVSGKPGLYLAMGHDRNGVLLAPWTAANLIDQIKDDL